jgi:hypothetical protein
MKKFIFLIWAALSSSILLSSCKKENPPAPPASITGFWKGKFGFGPTTYPDQRYAFLFRSDGTVRVFDNTDTSNAAIAEGTYAVNSSIVTTTYTYLNTTSQYSTKSFIYPQFTFMEGTWGVGQDEVNGGKFFVNKF